MLRKFMTIVTAFFMTVTMLMHASAASKVTITFKGEGGGFYGGVSERKISVEVGKRVWESPDGYDDPMILPEGKGFKGWSLEKNGAVDYNQDEIRTFKPGKDTTLYALYDKLVKITYDPAGGNYDYLEDQGLDIVSEEQSYTLNTEFYGPFYEPASSNPSTIFAGWTTKKNSNDVEYDNETITDCRPTQDMTFYAVYKPAINVTLRLNEGQWYTNDGFATAPATFTMKAPKGYPFYPQVMAWTENNARVHVGYQSGSDYYPIGEKALAFDKDITLDLVFTDYIWPTSINVPAEISLKVGQRLDVPVSYSPEGAYSPYPAVYADDSAYVKLIQRRNSGFTVEGAKVGETAISVATSNDNGLYLEKIIKVYVHEAGPEPEDPAACTVNGFCHYNGKDYWYEDGKRQGVSTDPKCFSYDGSLRGREIYDPKTDGWYWLDVIYDGAKAVNKEVYMPYIYQDEADHLKDDAWINAVAALSRRTDPENVDLTAQIVKAIKLHGGPGSGKWVRYDKDGRMIKGWYTVATSEDIKLYPSQAGNTYYYDRQTGLMAKGYTTIDGVTYYFDEITGVLGNAPN